MLVRLTNKEHFMRDIQDLGIRGMIVPISPEQISELERSYDVQLPSDYLNFITSINGANIDICVCFDYINNEGEQCQGLLSFINQIGIDNESVYGVNFCTELLRSELKENALLNNVLAIGSVFSFDFLYLNFDNNPPSVHLFIREEGELGMRNVANSFGEFIDMLYDPESV